MISHGVPSLFFASVHMNISLSIQGLINIKPNSVLETGFANKLNVFATKARNRLRKSFAELINHIGRAHKRNDGKTRVKKEKQRQETRVERAERTNHISYRKQGEELKKPENGSKSQQV